MHTGENEDGNLVESDISSSSSEDDG